MGLFPCWQKNEERESRDELRTSLYSILWDFLQFNIMTVANASVSFSGTFSSRDELRTSLHCILWDFLQFNVISVANAFVSFSGTFRCWLALSSQKTHDTPYSLLLCCCVSCVLPTIHRDSIYTAMIILLLYYYDIIAVYIFIIESNRYYIVKYYICIYNYKTASNKIVMKSYFDLINLYKKFKLCVIVLNNI